MNYQEALAEAKRRWGENAAIREASYRDPTIWRFVGKKEPDSTGDPRVDTFIAYGKGATWEEAFADATRQGY